MGKFIYSYPQVNQYILLKKNKLSNKYNDFFPTGKPKSFFARAKKIYVAKTVCHDVIRDFMSIEVVENHRR